MQTAVEWFYQRILAKDIKAVFEQAKEMEREQHSKTWDAALDKYEVRVGNYMRAYEDFDDYFAETYGSKGSDEQMVEDTFKVWECCGMENCICKGSDETPMISRLKEHLSNITTEQFNNEIDEIHKDLGTSSQTEISDEEIEKAVMDSMDYVYLNPNDSLIFHQGWMRAIKWYREQLNNNLKLK